MPNLSFYPAPFIVLVLAVLMIFSFILGRRAYLWWRRRKIKDEEAGFSAVEGSLLGLLALMLSFTFSLSSSHHDRRIYVVNDEANAIGTAIMRADLYPDSIRKAFRKDFRQYLETRIRFFEVGVDIKQAYAALAEGEIWQKKLWERASYFSHKPEYLLPSQMMIPALNSMIDDVSTRNTALLAKVPDIIFYILFLLCIVSALTLGYSLGNRVDWTMKLGFTAMVCMSLYLAMDLDRARRGMINVSFVNQQILDLRNQFTVGE